jgi:hypothetical protein
MADAAWSPVDSSFRSPGMGVITLPRGQSFHGSGEYIAAPVASTLTDREHAD